jgi:hypothetical protein
MRAQRESHLVPFTRLQTNCLMNNVSAPGIQSINSFHAVTQTRSMMSSKVYHCTVSITASKCAQSLPPSEAPNSHSYKVQVRPPIACTCISTVTQSWPACVSLSLINVTVTKCITPVPRSRALRASLYSLDYHLPVYLPLPSIPGSKCISKFP